MVSPNEAPSQVPSTVASVNKTALDGAANAGRAASAAGVPDSAIFPIEERSPGGHEVEAAGPAEAHAAQEQKEEKTEGFGAAAKGSEEQQQPPPQMENSTTALTGSGCAERDQVQKGAKNKSGREETAGEKLSVSRKKRKTDGAGNNSDFPKTRDEMSPDLLQQRIKRQVEYYLSDENLTFDPFFQGKMKEAAQQGVGEALEINFVLQSPRMQQLHISQDELLAAVQHSSFIKVKRTEDGKVFLYREAPLPELKERCSRRGGAAAASGVRQESHGLGKDCHAVGCFLRVRNIPAEITQWQQVKDAIRAALPGEVLVRFVSNIEAVPANSSNSSSRRQCWVLLAPFEDDRATIEKQQPIKVFFSSQQHKGEEKTATTAAAAGKAPAAEAGKEASHAEAILMHEKEVKKACSEMPARLRMNHERDVQQLRRQLAGLPLLLKKEVKFNSVEHLRKCVAEFLQKTAAGERLRPGGAAEKAILALLDYHPKAFFKKGGRDKQVVGAKVGLHEKRDAQGHQQKRFFVIRRNTETGEEDEEDFSENKCIAELAKDPPCEPEALAQLLKTRNGLAAQKRAQAAAQAATRKRNREEAARMAAPSPPPASSPPACTAAGTSCREQQQQQQLDASVATEGAEQQQQARAGETDATAARQPQPGEAAAAAVNEEAAEAAASHQQTWAAAKTEAGGKKAAAGCAEPTPAESQSN